MSPEDPNLYECTLFLTEQVNGVTVNIAHYARGWTDTTNTTTLLASIQQSAYDSINAYQKFTTVPDLTFNVVATVPRCNHARASKPGFLSSEPRAPSPSTPLQLLDRSGG